MVTLLIDELEGWWMLLEESNQLGRTDRKLVCCCCQIKIGSNNMVKRFGENGWEIVVRVGNSNSAASRSG